jgi:AcrR family transcriptional regulator
MANDQKRKKNRHTTEQAILEAFVAILAHDGFPKANIEAIARKAGYNKALIYRYFGGLDGLIKALAQSDIFLPTPAQLFPDGLADILQQPATTRLNIALKQYARALRTRPATVQIILHALSNTESKSSLLEAIRTMQAHDLRQALYLTKTDTTMDLESIFAMFLGSFVFLVGLECRTMRTAKDLPTAVGDAFWHKIENVIDHLIPATETI